MDMLYINIFNGEDGDKIDFIINIIGEEDNISTLMVNIVHSIYVAMDNTIFLVMMYIYLMLKITAYDIIFNNIKFTAILIQICWILDLWWIGPIPIILNTLFEWSQISVISLLFTMVSRRCSVGRDYIVEWSPELRDIVWKVFWWMRLFVVNIPSGYLTSPWKPWYRWPVEIDGLPIKNGDFPWLC